MTETDMNVLLDCGLFSNITREEALHLLTCLAPKAEHFRRGETIWGQGDAVTACAVVLRGSVRAETLRADGGRYIIAQHGAGALVGDVLMSTAERRSPIFLVMAADGALAFIEFAKIMGGCASCCTAHTRLRENLLNELAEKYWALRRKTAYLSSPSLRKRAAMLLVDKRRSAGSDEFSLGFGRDDMADFLAVKRSALSRELSRMRHDGLIDFSRDRFHILDANALIAAADGEQAE